jgi:translocation protein SEC72
MTETFFSVPLKIDEKTKSVVCSQHSPPICSKCDLDFQSLNTIYRSVNRLPGDSQIPPPSDRPHPNHSTNIDKLRKSGMRSYEVHKLQDTFNYFNYTIEMSLGRSPWESADLCRDETVILLAYRSAVRFWLKQYVESLADAEAIVLLKKPWARGHFLKGRALQAMGLLDEALLAIELGLLIEPKDKDCNFVFKEIMKTLDIEQSRSR